MIMIRECVLTRNYCSYGYYRWNIGLAEDERYHKIEVNDKDSISNPILSDTPIPAFIKAEEIYNLLSTYISSLNDRDCRYSLRYSEG